MCVCKKNKQNWDFSQDMYMSDSETEEDGGYLKRVKPENKSIVILKGSIAVGDLESGVDFEIEEVNRELLDGPNGDARLEAEDNEEYISVSCSLSLSWLL